MSSRNENPTFAALTLGCKVNQYETEAICEALEAAGFTQRPSHEACDLYILNTCTVTAESDRKSRQMARRLIQKNPEAIVMVTGCSAQGNPASFAAIEGVSAVVGNRQKLRVAEIARTLLQNGKPDTPVVEVPSLEGSGFEPMSITRFVRARAYVKIQDGCESRCAYCAIPAARGPVRSKPMADVIAEVTALTEGDPARRWIVTHHLLELIGCTRTRTEELYDRLLDLLYDVADELDKRQRILILQRFADSNVPRNNGAIRCIHERTSLTPKMSEVLRKLADFTVTEADNQPDSIGWTDVPRRYRETLDGIRDAYERHVKTP